MYNLAYSLDSNYQRNIRYIYVSPEFMEKLTIFVSRNSDKVNHFYMRIIKKIKELFVYAIKTGIRSPLLKPNGDSFHRFPKLAFKYSDSVYKTM